MSADDADGAHLLAGIAALEPQHHRPAAPTGYPLHPWLLGAALALLLVGGRRYRPPSHALAPAILFTFSLVCAAAPNSAFASDRQERAAHRALQDGDYAQAAALYESVGGYTGKMGAGAAAYRRGAWTEARTHYQLAAELADDDVERALAHYNEANALARLGLLNQAVNDRRGARPASEPCPCRAQPRSAAAHAQANENERDESILPRIGDSGTGSGSGESAATTAASTEHSREESSVTAGDASGIPQTGIAILADDSGEFTSPAQPLRTAGDSLSIPAGTLRDDPREVLRHRFTVMDASRIRLPEQQTW